MMRLAEMSKRELEVLTGLVDGLTAREIGERMRISDRTVEWYIDQLKIKHGADRGDLISFARRAGLWVTDARLEVAARAAYEHDVATGVAWQDADEDVRAVYRDRQRVALLAAWQEAA